MLRFPKRALQNGSYVALRSKEGALIGRGILNRRSTIAFRLLGGPDAKISFRKLLQERLTEAHRLRTGLLRLQQHTNSWRWVHGEGDGLSGLVVDRYGSICVASLFSIGYVKGAEILEECLLAFGGVKEVIFQSDRRSQQLEGFSLPEPQPAPPVIVEEGRVRFRVQPGGHHKTGFFLDQRDNRRRVARLAQGSRMLDLCTNSGGFGITAAVETKGRDITALDLDEQALKQARANARLNHVKLNFVQADLFPYLREKSSAGETWPLVVLDPSKQATGPGNKERALQSYLDMNLLALQVVAPEGLLFTCSCTGSIREGEFLEVLRAAARQAGRRARVLWLSGAPPDHPVALDFPEGRYLKTVLLQVS